MSKKLLKDQIRAALAVSTPLIGIETADPIAAIKQIADARKKGAIIQWDCSQGFTSRNELGKQIIASIENPEERNASEAFAMMKKLPKDKNIIIVVLNLHNLVADPTGNSLFVVQALWNLREIFKSNGISLIGLGPELRFPPELANDFVILDDPLPTDAMRREIIEETVQGAAEQFDDFKKPDAKLIDRAVDVTRGMTAFMVEQQTASCTVDMTFDVDQLAERMRRVVNTTQGLSIHIGPESFETLGGLENAKNYYRRLFDNNDYGLVLFIDEIEKHFGGVAGDLSGVTQEQLGATLTWMEDMKVAGSVLIGPGGSGKSALAKSMGNYANIPTVVFDLAATRGSLVGESGRNIRLALKTVSAIAGDKPIFCVATCNSIAILPPELRRRFTHGTFFVDLPDGETDYRDRTERDAIWPIYQTGDLKKMERPEDEGWTGAEIRNCARIARELGMSLKEAAAYVVPISVSAKNQIDSIREQAAGKFLSASHVGKYREAPVEIQVSKPQKRVFRKEDE